MAGTNRWLSRSDSGRSSTGPYYRSYLCQFGRLLRRSRFRNRDPHAVGRISQFGIRRHPVQLYEIGVGLLALLVWWILRKRRDFDGQLFLASTAVYCFGRLFLDAFRANAWLSASGWHLLQIACLLITLTCLVLLERGSRKPSTSTSQSNQLAP